MTSIYVYKWKFAKKEKGDMERTIRLRLALPGFMDPEALDAEAPSGATRRSSQRLLASTTARKTQWTIASLDINLAFLKGLTHQEIAEATGERERA
eukprot:5423259-Pyramimonas_sp.AAC.1